MIVLGIAAAPLLHPTFLSPCPSPGAVSGAATLRTFALLIALARGGLTMLAGPRRATLARLRLPIALLALLPYALELAVEAAAARSLLPASAGLGSASPPAFALLAAAVWAPLSPSIVIPNMLAFQELGLEAASSAIGTAAPFEIGTAILVFSTVEGALLSGGSAGEAVGWVPVALLASAALGGLLAAAFEAYERLRLHPRAVALLQSPEPTEGLLVWLCLYLLAYELGGDAPSKVVPRSIGFLSALAMAVVTQLRLPARGASFAAALKPVWAFAEAFLFVLTGVVVRGAFGGATPAFSWGFAGVLCLGALARLCGDVAAGWAWVAADGGGGDRPSVSAVLHRTALLWSATLPKATLQASLGPRPSGEAAALGMPSSTAAFIAESAAVSILLLATLGSLLTFTVGVRVARALEEPRGGGAAAGEPEAGQALLAGTEMIN